MCTVDVENLDEAFSWHVIESPGCTYLAFVGELDMAAVTSLEHALDVVAGAGLPTTIDLSDVTFLDGGGLRVLMDLAQRLADRGITASFGPTPRSVSRYLQLAGVALD
jgi:anti-anti-sigma factor